MSYQTAGYGNVYRIYPQVQLQTPAQPVPLPVGPPPVAFPKLGQWGAEMYRYWPLVETAQRLRLIRVGDPAAYMPTPEAVYQPWWRVWRDRDWLEFQQRAYSKAQVGAPPTGLVAPWPVQLDPQWWRDPWSPAHYQQDIAPLVAIGDPPARMPRWEDAYQAFWRVWRPPLSPAHAQQDHTPPIPVGAPQALFGIVQPYIQPPPLHLAFFQPKLPMVQQVVIIVPPAFPPPWIANWAAYFTPPLPASFFQHLPPLRVGDAPAPFGSPNLLASYLRVPFQFPQVLPVTAQPLVIPLPVPPITWIAALYYRNLPFAFLQRPRFLAIDNTIIVIPPPPEPPPEPMIGVRLDVWERGVLASHWGRNG